MTAAPEKIASLLGRTRFLIDDEKRVQLSIANALSSAGLEFAREVRLSKTDIIDFITERIGIEVKIKAAKRAILRQCERYVSSEQIDALIVLSSVAIGLPDTISGKRILIVSIGRAWL